jgi:hypothetical protein
VRLISSDLSTKALLPAGHERGQQLARATAASTVVSSLHNRRILIPTSFLRPKPPLYTIFLASLTKEVSFRFCSVTVSIQPARIAMSKRGVSLLAQPQTPMTYLPSLPTTKRNSHYTTNPGKQETQDGMNKKKNANKGRELSPTWGSNPQP